MSNNYLTLEELQDVTNLAYKWARSYDFKDWDLLSSILAQKLYIDYRKTFLLEFHPEMSLPDFVKMMSNPGPTGLGNPDVRTQHLLGAPLYEKNDDGTIDVHWTIRAAHFQQKTGKTMHSHAVTTLKYMKEGGVMKISGVIPNVNWELGPPGEDLSH